MISSCFQEPFVVDFPNNDDEYSLPLEPPFDVQSPRDDVGLLILATVTTLPPMTMMGHLEMLAKKISLGLVWVRTTSRRAEPIVVRRSVRVRAGKLFVATC